MTWGENENLGTKYGIKFMSIYKIINKIKNICPFKTVEKVLRSTENIVLIQFTTLKITLHIYRQTKETRG